MILRFLYQRFLRKEITVIVSDFDGTIINRGQMNYWAAGYWFSSCGNVLKNVQDIRQKKAVPYLKSVPMGV